MRRSHGFRLFDVFQRDHAITAIQSAYSSRRGNSCLGPSSVAADLGNAHHAHPAGYRYDPWRRDQRSARQTGGNKSPLDQSSLWQFGDHEAGQKTHAAKPASHGWRRPDIAAPCPPAARRNSTNGSRALRNASSTASIITRACQSASSIGCSPTEIQTPPPSSRLPRVPRSRSRGWWVRVVAAYSAARAPRAARRR